jgi:hypothetical protein
MLAVVVSAGEGNLKEGGELSRPPWVFVIRIQTNFEN